MMTELLLSFAAAGVSMSAVIVIVLIFFRARGRKYSAKCAYIVWAAVILRLCVPFSLFPSLIRLPVPELAGGGVNSENAGTDSDISPSESYIPGRTPGDISGSVPAVQPETSINIDMNDTVSESGAEREETARLSVGTLPAETLPTETLPADTEVGAEGFAFFGVSAEAAARVLIICRFVGAAAFFAAEITGCLIGNRRLSRGLRTAPDETDALYHRLAEKLGVSSAPPLYVSRKVDSPMLCGFLKPKIILPELRLSDNSLVGILAHELIHYRRKDLWMKLAGVIASSSYWYNPLMRFAVRQMSDAMELACDEELLSGMDSDARRSYGRVLLEIMKSCRPSSNELNTHFNPRKNSVKERFVNIMNGYGKKRGIGVIALALALCLTVGIISCSSVGDGGSTDNSENTTDTPTDDETTSPEEDIVPEQTTEQKLAALLTANVTDIREEYGELKLEYSEYGPGQPVYSIENLPGVFLVFHGWNMDVPLTEYHMASEVMLSDDCALSVYGLKIGDMIENYNGSLVWNEAGNDFINGTCTLTAIKDFHKLTVVIHPEDEKDYPLDTDDSAVYDAWFKEWSESYKQSPEGKVLQIRIEKVYQDDFPETDGTERTATTLDGILELANAGRISESAYNFLYDMLSGKSAIADYNEFDVPSFTLTVTDTRKDIEFTLDFMVTGSKLDTLPDGEYHWELQDIIECCVINRGIKSVPDEYVDVPEVNMILYFIGGTYIWNTPTFGKGTEYPGMHNYLCHYYRKDPYSSVTLEDYKKYAAEKFGCEVKDEDLSVWLYDENGTTLVGDGGIGGGWTCTVDYVKKSGDDTLVGIQFYHDVNYLVKSHFIEYRFGKNDTWQGYTVVKKSAYEPTLSYTPDIGETMSVSDTAWLRNLRDKNYISESAFNLIYGIVSNNTGVEEYRSIKTNSFTLSFPRPADDELIGEGLTLTLSLDVRRSGVEAIPVGKDTLTIYDDPARGAVILFDDSWYLNAELDGFEEVRMLKAFLEYSRCWSTPSFGKGKEYSGMRQFLCWYYGDGDHELELSEFEKLAAEKFGCNDIDATDAADFINEKNGKKYVQGGEVSGVTRFRVENAETIDGVTDVTVRFYGDLNYIIKSYLVKYHFGENGKWLGYEVIEKSDVEPYGF